MRSRFRSGVRCGIRRRGTNPIRAAAAQVKASCATPVIGTVQASVRPMSQPAMAASHMAAMNTRFIRTGTNPASAKRPWAFSTPASMAKSEMKKI